MRSSLGRQVSEAAQRGKGGITLAHPLRLLDVNSVLKIDEALVRLGRRGEVRLIKKKGKVRFLETLRIEGVIDDD